MPRSVRGISSGTHTNTRQSSCGAGLVSLVGRPSATVRDVKEKNPRFSLTCDPLWKGRQTFGVPSGRVN
tara:strand:- start:640 stop:846 length:207 start_codon:yes stop_codon:yes gene_type:complete